MRRDDGDLRQRFRIDVERGAADRRPALPEPGEADGEPVEGDRVDGPDARRDSELRRARNRHVAATQESRDGRPLPSAAGDGCREEKQAVLLDDFRLRPRLQPMLYGVCHV